MTSHKKETTELVLGLALISVGGWLLHVRTHPFLPDAAGVVESENFIPFGAGLASIFVTPVLLWFRRTMLVGYLLNGMTAVVGTVLMTYYSVTMVRHPLTLAGVVTGTLLADVLIALAKLLIGQRILLTYHPSGTGRMFTAGWWTRHCFYVAAVFAFGHLVWR